MTAQELQDLNEAVRTFKSLHSDVEAEMKKYGEASGATLAKLDALNDRLTEIETGFKEFAGAKNRKGRDVSSNTGGYSEERKTFIEALRKNWTPEQAQAKGLSLSTDTAGGFTAPGDYVAEMIRTVVEVSAIRSISRVMTIGGPHVHMPKRTQTTAASWVAELGTRAETQNPAFGMENIPVHELYAMTKVSRQLLEDSKFDLDQFLREEFGEQFALAEGTSFISGNAVGKPEGFLTNSQVAFTLNGHATTLQADAVLGITFDIKAPYWPNARYVMSRATLKAVRLLKDSQNQYLWHSGLNSGTQPTLCGFPYTLAEDMPTIASGNFPIAFGDFKRGYLVVDRIVMDVMIDTITSKATGMVEFSARKRVGGQVILAEAIRTLKMATS